MTPFIGKRITAFASPAGTQATGNFRASTATSVRSLIIAALAALLHQSCMAQEIRQGGWNARLRMSLWDDKAHVYRTLSDDSRQECFSRSYLESQPFTEPAAEMKKLESSFGRCTLIDQARSATAASWSIECLAADGLRLKYRADHEISAESLTLLAEGETTNSRGDVSRTRALREYQFTGACAPGTSVR